MEEVSAYIESGILELYVLGQLSEAENKEVEAMVAKYPLVKKELSAIEIALEAYAQENAIAPSADLGDRILAQFAATTVNEVNQPKVVPLYEDRSSGKIRTLRFALVASIALLVFSLISLYSLNNKLTTARQQIVSLSSEKQQFATTVSKMKFDYDGMQNRIAMTESNEWTTVKLAGVKNTPSAKMLVYWNKNNKDILINYAAINLPETDQSHEYQLWALVDGKPVSLGVFTSHDRAKSAIQEMEAIPQAQAFAVTIEPNGGSNNPTMEKMVVMGTI